MYTVKYEEYHNDYMRKNMSKTFNSMTEIENWMFDQMQQSYDKMYFPFREPSRIEFTPKWGGPHYWIYYIASERGIEFTEGHFTNGQKHWSKDIQSFLSRCRDRQKKPEFVFAE